MIKTSFAFKLLIPGVCCFLPLLLYPGWAAARVPEVGRVNPELGYTEPDTNTTLFADTVENIEHIHEQLEGVIITATPLHRKLDAIPGSISVIGPLNPLTSQTTSINSILELVPGIQMQAGTNNTARLTIRGIGSRSPFSSNRVRAFLNEIPLTGGDGSTIVEDLEIWEMERVEIIRGPASALYGSGLGGTLVFRPAAAPPNKWSSRVILEGGSFGFFKAGARVAHRDANNSVNVGLYRTVSEGHRQNNSYERVNAMMRTITHFKKHDISLLVNHVNLFARIPSSVNRETYLVNPRLAAPNWLAVKGYQQYNKWQSGVTVSSTINPTLVNHVSLYAIMNNGHESRPFNILEEETFTAGVRNRLVLSRKGIAASLGFEVFGERYKWEIYQTTGGTRGSLRARNQDDRFFLNLFLHGEWLPLPETRLTTGLNLHNSTFSSKSAIIAETAGSPPISYPNQLVLSPRLGLSQRVSSTTHVYASAGHGFSVPSSDETILPDGSINLNLKPEEGINLDIGIRSSFPATRSRLEVTAYRIWVKNLLITRRDTEDQFYGENAGRTIHQGIESRFYLDFIRPRASNSRSLKLVMAHTLMDNHFVEFTQDELDLAGKKLPGLPTSSLNAQLKYHTPSGLYMAIGLTRVNSQYLNDLNTLSYPGHELFDITGSYSPVKGGLAGFNVKVGIRNLLDTRHASMILINAPSFGNAPPRYYYPGEPRNFFVGLSFMID